MARDERNVRKTALVELRLKALEGRPGAFEAYADAFDRAVADGLILREAPRPVQDGSGGVAKLAAYDANLWADAIAAPQERSNWCGPATAYTALKHYGKMTSQWDGQPLSQSALAGPLYTDAGLYGGTDWVDNDMPRALNRWGGFNFSQKSPATALVLKNDITSAIDWWVVPPQSTMNRI